MAHILSVILLGFLLLVQDPVHAAKQINGGSGKLKITEFSAPSPDKKNPGLVPPGSQQEFPVTVKNISNKTLNIYVELYGTPVDATGPKDPRIFKGISVPWTLKAGDSVRFKSGKTLELKPGIYKVSAAAFYTAGNNDFVGDKKIVIMTVGAKLKAEDLKAYIKTKKGDELLKLPAEIDIEDKVFFKIKLQNESKWKCPEVGASIIFTKGDKEYILNVPKKNWVTLKSGETKVVQTDLWKANIETPNGKKKPRTAGLYAFAVMPEVGGSFMQEKPVSEPSYRLLVGEAIPELVGEITTKPKLKIEEQPGDGFRKFLGSGVITPGDDLKISAGFENTGDRAAEVVAEITVEKALDDEFFYQDSEKITLKPAEKKKLDTKIPFTEFGPGEYKVICSYIDYSSFQEKKLAQLWITPLQVGKKELFRGLVDLDPPSPVPIGATTVKLSTEIFNSGESEAGAYGVLEINPPAGGDDHKVIVTPILKIPVGEQKTLEIDIDTSLLRKGSNNLIFFAYDTTDKEIPDATGKARFQTSLIYGDIKLKVTNIIHPSKVALGADIPLTVVVYNDGTAPGKVNSEIAVNPGDSGRSQYIVTDFVDIAEKSFAAISIDLKDYLSLGHNRIVVHTIDADGAKIPLEIPGYDEPVYGASIQVGQADLKAAISVDSKVDPGQDINLSMVVTNSGTAPKDVYAEIYINSGTPDETVVITDSVIAAASLDTPIPLKVAGVNHNLNEYLKLGHNMAVIAIVDADGARVPVTGYPDGFRQSIQVGQAILELLGISILPPGQQPDKGGEVKLDVTLKNSGTISGKFYLEAYFNFKPGDAPVIIPGVSVGAGEVLNFQTDVSNYLKEGYNNIIVVIVDDLDARLGDFRTYSYLLGPKPDMKLTAVIIDPRSLTSPPGAWANINVFNDPNAGPGNAYAVIYVNEVFNALPTIIIGPDKLPGLKKGVQPGEIGLLGGEITAILNAEGAVPSLYRFIVYAYDANTEAQIGVYRATVTLTN